MTKQRQLSGPVSDKLPAAKSSVCLVGAPCAPPAGLRPSYPSCLVLLAGTQTWGRFQEARVHLGCLSKQTSENQTKKTKTLQNVIYGLEILTWSKEVHEE